MAWDIAAGAGVTALGLAAARSVESGRTDRLIEDPYARALFEAADADLPMLVDWPEDESAVSDAQALHLHGSRYIGLRTRFYDEALVAAALAGVEQSVLFGAGLDTRAFRLDLPEDFALFELDQAGVLDFKRETLDALGTGPRCRLSSIGIDLREDWPAALLDRGFDPARPTAWIAEGLLPYLPPEAQVELLGRIHELSAPGSSLWFDRIAGDPATGDRLRDLTERSGIDMECLLASGEAGDLAGFLREREWLVVEAPTTELAERYGRDLSDPFGSAGDSGPAEPPWLDTMFLSARLDAG
jgi:methyltransferase (TIGR00027 family)